MATTPKGIYYPNDYNEIADIPEDMKKMAESIDEVFEDTDSDLSDIKEEQTTQNNRLNSLETDNTTNKSNISSNTQEINNIKQEQTEQNTNISTNATNIESLQQENENLKKIVSQLPQVEGQGTSITLENTIEAQFTKFDVEGNSDQETTEGKNLCPTKSFESLSKVRIVSNNTEYGETVQGIPVSVGTYTASFDVTTLPSLDYRIQLVASSDSTQSQSANDITNPILTVTNSFSSLGRKTLSIAVEQSCYLYLRCVPVGFGLDNIQIEQGSATDYEPYTGGIASPNPSYEQPIKSAGDNVNLLTLDDVASSSTIINNEDGSLTFNGNVPSMSISLTNPIILKANKTYTLSLSEILSESIANSQFALRNGPTNIMSIRFDAKSISYTPTEDITIDTIRIYNGGISFDNYTFFIKLEEGNKATPYSPYGMGSINEKIMNKNLWDIDKFKNLYGTNTYETYNNVECLKLAGATQRYDFEGEENTQYTFQFKLIGSTINNEIGAFSLVYSDGTSDYHDGILTPKTYTFTSKANKTLVRIVWLAWNAGNFIYIDKNSMQLEPGTTATPYVPHKEQDYSIFVQQPFRSIGDIRDCFVKKSDGWYERHYIARYICKGNEVFLNQTELETVSRWIIQMIGAKTGSALSNYYTYYPNYTASTEHFYVSSNQILTFHNKTITSNSQYLQYFAEKYASGNPVYVDYLLAEPLDLPCTEEQIQQLENLPSTYKDFTIINSEDETPAYLEVSGIRDINTMFDKVTNAIVSLGGNV